MNSFDDDIHDALKADDAALKSAGDEGMIQQVTATFRSRMRVWVVISWVATLFWTGVAAWAAVAFFRAQDTRGWIMHASIFLAACMAVAMLKLWYLMELNRNTHTREIKRVEMQVARLAEKVK